MPRIRLATSALLALALAALGRPDAPRAEEHPGWDLLAEIKLGSELVYLRNLGDSLAARGLHELVVEPIARHGYRVDPLLTGTDPLFLARTLSPLPLTALATGDSLVLRHDIGLDDAGFAREIEAAADSIEAAVGQRPVSFAYPYHIHTRELMDSLRAQGWLCARDGAPHGTGGGEPTAAFLLGYHAQPAWRQNWDYWTPWELVLSTGLTEKAIQVATSPAEIDLLLYDTAAYNALHATPPQSVDVFTYEFASLADLWVTGRCCVQLYVHGASGDAYHLEPTHLAWLMDALAADGRFWITSVGEAAAWAAARHAPSAADSLVWLPLPEYAADPAPWNGYPAAFCFSTDDGRRINLAYADTLAVRGLPMSTFVTWNYLGHPAGDHLSREDLVALAARGNVEIGSHTLSHPRLVPDRALSLRNQGARRLACEITGGREERRLRVYGASPSAAPPAPAAAELSLRCQPGPERGACRIEFSLARAQRVQLELLDLRGRRLARLLAEPREAGTASLRWNGRDGQGRRLASGLYLLRLRGEQATVTAKALLLR
ncbi:hypothetical protein FJ251_11925 [bacterium]|nr:hypothetical protein [bacterium]